jgi:hypothetical protein
MLSMKIFKNSFQRLREFSAFLLLGTVAALLSFAAGPIAWIISIMMKVDKIHGDATVETGH